MKYTIYGTKWADTPRFAEWDKHHSYPIFDAIDKVVVEKEFDSMNAAHVWMLNNLPEYAIGRNIKCENGSFSMCAAKIYFVDQGITSYDEMVEYERAFYTKRL